MAQRFYNVRPSIGSALVGLLVFVLFVWFTFKLAAFAFKIMWFAGPILLILAFFIDRQTVLGFFRWLGQAFRQNPLQGFLYALLALFAYPLVCGWLFVKALLKRFVRTKINEMQDKVREQQEAYNPGGMSGSDPNYETLNREDGLTIRIPKP